MRYFCFHASAFTELSYIVRCKLLLNLETAAKTYLYKVQYLRKNPLIGELSTVVYNGYVY